MTEAGTADEGGDAPCAAHLLDPNDRLTEAALAGLTRELADALVVADVAGTIVFWNRAAEHLFGWSAQDAVDRSLDLIIPERLRARHWEGYRHAMAAGHSRYGSQLLEVPALHQDGRMLSVAFTVTLLREPGSGTVTGIAAVLRDDTERWRERRELQERVATLEVLGGSARHS